MSPSLEPAGSQRETDQDNRSRLLSILAIALACLILAWPAAVNRGPFFLADTTAYLRTADAAFAGTFGYSSRWSDKIALYEGVEAGKAGPDDAKVPAAESPAHPPLIGRSIYYGALLYFPVIGLGEGSAVIVQTLIAALALWLAMLPLTRRLSARQRSAVFLIAALCLAVFTPLAYVTSLVMPDYLTGVALIAMASLLFFWGRYSLPERILLGGMVVLAGVSHSSNLPLILTMMAVGGLMMMTGRRIARPALAIGLLALVLGVAGDWVFSHAVEAKLGIKPIRPPFLTARLIADGPGYRLMREECAEPSFVVCAYIRRTPHDSDVFLWDTDSATGVFSAIPFDQQRRLSEQDAAFALATVEAYPIATAESSLRAFVRQLTLFDLRIWRGMADGGIVDFENLPDTVAERMKGTLNAKGAMPTEPVEFLTIVLMVASVPAAFALLHRGRKSADPSVRGYSNAVALAVLGILANAAVAGGLSKPDARYNLRIVWTLPFLIACCGGAQYLDRSRRRQDTPTEKNA